MVLPYAASSVGRGLKIFFGNRIAVGFFGFFFWSGLRALIRAQKERRPVPVRLKTRRAML